MRKTDLKEIGLLNNINELIDIYDRYKEVIRFCDNRCMNDGDSCDRETCIKICFDIAIDGLRKYI